MKNSEIKRIRKEEAAVINKRAAQVLGRDGVRLDLICAELIILTVAYLIYLLLSLASDYVISAYAGLSDYNYIKLIGFALSIPAAAAASPAVFGFRMTVCDIAGGRKPELSGIFAPYGSLKLLGEALLSFLFWLVRWGCAIALCTVWAIAGLEGPGRLIIMLCGFVCLPFWLILTRNQPLFSYLIILNGGLRGVTRMSPQLRAASKRTLKLRSGYIGESALSVLTLLILSVTDLIPKASLATAMSLLSSSGGAEFETDGYSDECPEDNPNSN